MITARTFTRSAAVLGAATALTFAGAGAAMATTTSHNVEGNLLSVTFEQESWIDGALCFAVAVPTAGAAGVVDQVQGAASGPL